MKWKYLGSELVSKKVSVHSAFLKFQIFATKDGVTLAVIATSQVPHAPLG